MVVESWESYKKSHIYCEKFNCFAFKNDGQLATQELTIWHCTTREIVDFTSHINLYCVLRFFSVALNLDNRRNSARFQEKRTGVDLLTFTTDLLVCNISLSLLYATTLKVKTQFVFDSFWLNTFLSNCPVSFRMRWWEVFQLNPRRHLL